MKTVRNEFFKRFPAVAALALLCSACATSSAPQAPSRATLDEELKSGEVCNIVAAEKLAVRGSAVSPELVLELLQKSDDPLLREFLLPLFPERLAQHADEIDADLPVRFDSEKSRNVGLVAALRKELPGANFRALEITSCGRIRRSGSDKAEKLEAQTSSGLGSGKVETLKVQTSALSQSLDRALERLNAVSAENAQQKAEQETAKSKAAALSTEASVYTLQNLKATLTLDTGTVEIEVKDGRLTRETRRRLRAAGTEEMRSKPKRLKATRPGRSSAKDLWAALQSGSASRAREALDGGADPKSAKMVDGNAMSALGFAVEKGNFEIAELLFAYGAKASRDIVLKAVEKNDADMVCLFARYGMEGATWFQAGGKLLRGARKDATTYSGKGFSIYQNAPTEAVAALVAAGENMVSIGREHYGSDPAVKLLKIMVGAGFNATGLRHLALAETEKGVELQKLLDLGLDPESRTDNGVPLIEALHKYPAAVTTLARAGATVSPQLLAYCRERSENRRDRESKEYEKLVQTLESLAAAK